MKITVNRCEKEDLEKIKPAVLHALGLRMGLRITIEDDPEIEVFDPKEGDICAIEINGGDTSAIFQLSGRRRVDAEGNVWILASKSVWNSGDLLHPYRVLFNEKIYLQEISRMATDEERELFHRVTQSDERENFGADG